MTFTELKYFIEVYQQKSISLASKNLYVVPSVISEAIKRLETEFNLLFFTRYSNRIEPTYAGNIFYQYALKITNYSLQMRQALHALNPGNSVTQIKMAFPDNIVYYYYDIFMPFLKNKYPTMDFIIDNLNISPRIPLTTEHDIILFPTTNYSSSKITALLSSLETYDYQIHYLAKTPIYVWAKKESCLSSSSLSTLSKLMSSKYRLVLLSNICNAINSLELINYKYNPQISNKTIFIERLSSGTCFAIDMATPSGKSVYDKLLANSDHLKKRELVDKCTYLLLYKKQFYDFIPFISNLFLEISPSIQ